ncbi:MAG: hypothetical protein GNW80_00805 [Asgard group archaeon]|nr:hypothetical protein [Asgard group archaeon]
MSNDVGRIFGIDFIYFDLMLVTVWMALLFVRKRYKEFFFGLFGYGVVQFVDAVIWYTIKGTRIIDTGGVIGPHVFLTYFSFTYGMIMFSFAPLMFNKKIHVVEKLMWAGLMYCGWLAIGLMSKYIVWDDRIININRDMGNARIKQIIMASVGYAILLIWKVLSEFLDGFPWNIMKNIPYWYFGILIVTGIFIHFSMESTLMIAGIRPIDWEVLAVNSLLEFNTGIPILFGLWTAFNWNDYIPKSPAETEETEAVLTQTPEKVLVE